jgi:hypothetical protein
MTLGYANKDEFGYFRVNGKIVSVIYYKYNILEDFNQEVYEFLETSTSVKCPNIYSFLANLKPVYNTIIQKDYLNKYFKEEELVNEVTRFLPASFILGSIKERSEKERLVNEIKESAGAGWTAINFKNYYSNFSEKGIKLATEASYITSAYEAISLIDSDASKEHDYLFIQEIVAPSYQSLVLSNKNLFKKSLSNRIGVLSFSLIQDTSVISNKNLSIYSKSAPSDENVYNTHRDSYENYALDVPLLRTDINIKQIGAINYN